MSKEPIMTTKLIRSLYNCTPDHKGSVLTIGNFDGVHLGHQQLIKRAIVAAKERNTFSMVLTFEPHPLEFFQDRPSIPRLTRLREKFFWLAHYGIDVILVLPFNQWLANLSSTDFITQILSEQLSVQHILVGNDFRFGQQRMGDVTQLAALGNQLGFSTETVPTFFLEEKLISSTRVRQALADGSHQLVKRLLNRPYSMMGRIRGGNRLGRKLGFPTANIFLHRELSPVQGIYTVLMHGITDQGLPGVANVGFRPTVDGTRALLEVHLLNFNQDIYGRYVKIEFCEKIRNEIRYPNLDLLKAQIEEDFEDASNYFKKNGVL